MINVGVFGASGRMGQAVIQALADDNEAKLGAAIVRKSSNSTVDEKEAAAAAGAARWKKKRDCTSAPCG